MAKTTVAALKERLIDAFSDVTSLTITTSVGDITTQGKIQDNSEQHSQDMQLNVSSAPTLRTRIDLLDGDITTLISEQLLAEKYASVIQLHKENEQRGMAIIRENIETLKALYHFVSKELEPSSPRS
ncbi:MAG: hypothetical protein ACKO6N_21770 [Myxococcota bacterium]